MSGTSPRTNEGAYTQDVTGVDAIVLANKFRLIRELCVHDDELIYEAVHTATERRVRVHMLGHDEPAKSPLAERMRRAARAAGRVPHPNVLGVVDSGVDPQNRPFLVYEYFGSVNLSDVVSDSGPLPTDQAAHVICQLLDALGALHQRGVVHRCVRPENVLVERVGGELRVKLTGFGLAVVQGKFDDAPALPRGFSRYLAPEARRNPQVATPAIDIYAAGVLMRYLLTGDAGAAEGIDARAERALLRATADDPDERFTAAEHFAASISMLLPEAGSDSAPPEDALAADLRYMQRRRERDSGVGLAPTGASRMELYPTLMMIEAIYARLGAAGWKQLCEELPAVEQLLPGAGLGPRYQKEGVPSDLVIAMLRAADAQGGRGDLAWLTEIGDALVKRGLARFCPSLPKQLSPPVLVDCVAQIWAALSRHGEVVVTERAQSSARIAIRAQTAPSLELCAVLAGLLRAQLRALAPDAEVNTVASQALGDAADVYVLSWNSAR